jgi:hypothetical protein
VKAFFKFLVSLASFLMLCAMLVLLSSLGIAAFVQLDAMGVPSRRN